MPSAVIFAFGEKPQIVRLQGTEYLVGRSENADICLPHDSVSRTHATIVKEDSSYRIVPMNVSNAIILNGKELDGPATLPDEAELQFGPFLVLFSRQNVPPSSLVGGRPFRFEMKCTGCGWSGLISGYKTGQTCPRCAGKDFVDVDSEQRSAAARDSTGPTSYVSIAEMNKLMEQVKVASRTKIVRMKQVEGLPKDIFLEQDRVVVFGKPGESNMPVKTWLRWGAPAEIRWRSDHYAIEHKGGFPGLKVNGNKTKFATIKDGDTIEIGSVLFNVSTE
jgi:hypothetical protein